MGSHFDRALILFRQSRFDLAEQELRQDLAEDPNNGVTTALLGLCLSQRSAYKEATATVESALALAPTLPFVHYALANILYARNRFVEALTPLQEALRLDPGEPDYFSLLSSTYFSLERWPEALQAAEQGLSVNAEHLGCMNVRVMALVKLGRTGQASIAIEEALRRDPDDALAHANQGWLFLEAGKVEAALAAFRESLRLAPSLEWARRGIVEAMKARNPLYRIFLAYALWSVKLKPIFRVALVFGLFLSLGFLTKLTDAFPKLEPLFWIAFGLYLCFAVFSWIATPLSNLLLRLDRFGRLALSQEETMATNWFGGMVLAASICGIIGIFGKNIFFSMAAVALLLSVLPLSAVFRCDPGWPRTVMAGLTAVLVACGLLGTLGLALGDSGLWLSAPALGLFGGGFLISTWMGNILAQVTVKA
jgi:tetratricopeptide (TPR) repeat protein